VVWETPASQCGALNVNCKNAELLQAMRIEGDLRDSRGERTSLTRAPITLDVYAELGPGNQSGMIWLLLFILLILIVGVVGAVKIALWVILLAVLFAVLAGFMGRSLFSR
jgi:hypothetical protein